MAAIALLLFESCCCQLPPALLNFDCTWGKRYLQHAVVANMTDFVVVTPYNDMTGKMIARSSRI